ncbi:MAG TPA: MOSC N-terminal beta barrel domain-containing protein [Acidimicrobiia bacterium]|jgi:hypothetical protein|nr:MOSC N-terminal beta barrel domain-containing protein [Acidimicrobiia bacterium]
MELAQIWRYPVKSLQGEQLDAAEVDGDGLRGDRLWGIRDEATGKILTARREPTLLFASASLDDAGQPAIALPSGETRPGVGPDTDAALSAWLERPVSLVAAAGVDAGRAEFFADATDDSSRAIEWTMPPGRFVDALPLLLVTTSSLHAAAELHPGGAWDTRRVRPNLLIETDGDGGWVEDAWCGKPVRVGAAELVPRQPCLRCTMVTRPQPGLERDLEIFKTLAKHHGNTFGVWTSVTTPGAIRAGDPVAVAT